MRDPLGVLRRAVGGIDRREALAYTGLAGVWLLRVVLGVALVVFALSFVGPPPAETTDVDVATPESAAHDAVSNLRAETYRLAVVAERPGASEDASTYLRETRVVDNRGRLYVTSRATGAALANDAASPERVYGTTTTGYRQAASGPGADGVAGWERDPSLRYYPTVNAFGNVNRLDDASTTVVTNSSETYAVRIEDADVAAAVVDLPDHAPRRAEAWNATLTLSMARETDRLRRAEYRYRQPERGTVVRATYRFEYGSLVDVDRPLGTYPPGDELVSRLDLGLRVLYAPFGGRSP